MEKFNVILDERSKKETRVVVEVESEDKLNEILDDLDYSIDDYDSYNSDDYIRALEKKLNVVEVIKGDEEVTGLECADYCEYDE